MSKVDWPKKTRSPGTTGSSGPSFAVASYLLHGGAEQGRSGPGLAVGLGGGEDPGDIAV